MGLFKKNKKDNAEEKTSVSENITVTNINSNEDYGLAPEVAQAIDNIIPVISNGDLNLIPSVYSAEVLNTALSEATLEDLLVLADYAYSLIAKSEQNQQGFIPTFLNAIAAELANRIKSAEKLYTVYSNSLFKNPYPQIAAGYALIFFNEENAVAWAEDYIKNHECEVEVRTLGKDEIKGYFEELISLGIKNIGIESNISKITINHQPIFGVEFKTVADPAVQFLSLRFIQLDKSKVYHDKAKQSYGALLSAIMASKFICPGRTINGKFTAATLKRGDSSFISVFTDKKELNRSMEENPSAKDFLSTAELKEVTFEQLEEFLTSPNVSALVINISGMGFTLKREICENLYNVIKSNPGKRVTINIE